MELRRVFVSHKLEDSHAAMRVAGTLRSSPDVDAYVDVLEPQLGKSAVYLTDYVRRHWMRVPT